MLRLTKVSNSISYTLAHAESQCSLIAVYDRDFDAAVVLAQTAASTLPASTSSSGGSRAVVAPENQRKRRRVDYRPWSPGPRERALMGSCSSPLESVSTSDLPRVLRGLSNLGNTCFMNSVLQALLHTPLRNYFLSDRHNRNVDGALDGGHGSKNGSFCLACDMDAMFSAVFSGERMPCSPAKFLYSFTSTTHDPCLDISLDLEQNLHGSVKATSAKSHRSCNGEAECINSSQNSGIPTLMGCLDRFTRPERLGSDQKLFCQQRQVSQESLKQMSIRKLPLASCFHIKRFEHSSIQKMSRKIDRYLHFPFSLDMAPYLSSSILRRRFGNGIFPFDGDEPDASNEFSSEFELFTVVTHAGKLDAGHFVTYLRLSSQWYKCDDAWITQVNGNIVRAAQGYMMFYVHKMLYYRASDKSGAS
ncbi:hypothetical protein EUGRSUZ_C00331 [Eucalyptus grandis]|uniref:ubiquitinyl hydrolase 1 n=2 Tax=Eucalyptus grandis TaxID=71139 RepID=A0A059CLU1_EUCGR|nr:hypothetical protein EUGRSUZ_C00331 [Eucalyptus grandis]